MLFVQDTTTSAVGAASGKITTFARQANEGIWQTINAAGPTMPYILRSGRHTVSAYMKGNGTVRFRITNAAGTSDLFISPSFTLGADWTRYTFSTSSNLFTGTGYRLYIETASLQGTTFWVDGIQLESRNVASDFYPGIRPAGQGRVGKALKAAKPAGLIMDYQVVDGQTFLMLRDGSGGRTFNGVKTQYATFQDARDDLPI